MTITNRANNFMGVMTKQAVYLCANIDGKVNVRILGDFATVDGTWVEAPKVSDDWEETAKFFVASWEASIECPKVIYHTDRDFCWKEAVKHGPMILDYIHKGKWYCTVFKSKGSC